MPPPSTARARPHPAKGTYYHPEFKAHAVKVYLGQHRISDDPTVMLVTTLGSCVSACVWDPVIRIGGMNHFLLPDVPASDALWANDAARYGSVAMERLINDILAQGGRRDRLEIKVFGGARVIELSFDIGESNGRFVIDYIEREGLRLTGHDLGGSFPRRVHWFPTTGRALRRLLNSEALDETASEELRFRSSLRRTPLEGDVTLFDED